MRPSRQDNTEASVDMVGCPVSQSMYASVFCGKKDAARGPDGNEGKVSPPKSLVEPLNLSGPQYTRHENHARAELIYRRMTGQEESPFPTSLCGGGSVSTSEAI